LYGKPPALIDKEIKKKIIGDEEPITCRPANLLKHELNSIPEEVKPLIESDEDILTYVLFHKTAVEFLKKRAAKREESAVAISVSEREELEEVAAMSTAIATYISSQREVKALIPTRKAGTVSAWSLAVRQELARRG